MESITTSGPEPAGVPHLGMPSAADRRRSRPIPLALADVAPNVVVLDVGKLNVLVHELVALLRSAGQGLNPSPGDQIVGVGDARIDLFVKTVTKTTGERIRLTPNGSSSNSCYAVPASWYTATRCSLSCGAARTMSIRAICVSSWWSCAASWNPNLAGRAIW